MKQKWLYLGREELAVERQQLQDEGQDLTSVAAEFDALAALDLDADLSYQPRVNALFDRAQNLPLRSDYPYFEPSDRDAIRNARPAGPRTFPLHLDENEVYDRVLGAWLGRCAGCLLGKPIEGWHSPTLWGYLRDLDQYPLSDYLRSDVPANILARYNLSRTRAYIDRVSHIPEDDDLNYTVTGLAVFKQHGSVFSPDDVATFWLRNLPILHTYTAERIAYRNFSQMIAPPQSASYHNPFREWIGAQIRADFWGYVALGNPQLAAEFAWRDASISHTKNAIYGEMWVAAMLAAAPFVQAPRELIEIGLSEIPRASRLAADIQMVLSWHQAGIEYDHAVQRIHARWDETNPHHWTHTNSNAQIVAVGLLWGEGDFGKSICRAVQACFDADCNGATVGSIWGMMHGAQALPEHWIRPLNDELETGITGYALVRISELARQTCTLAKTIPPASSPD
ncbi:MAG TPA: ADP-ribosylglycohydrolase family protein [Anaerolineae bacterium]|nr:ADP-ribosylglycohydrolase family protein [Anaerolineae bacterium]